MPTHGVGRCDGHHKMVDCNGASGVLAAPGRPQAKTSAFMGLLISPAAPPTALLLRIGDIEFFDSFLDRVFRVRRLDAAENSRGSPFDAGDFAGAHLGRFLLDRPRPAISAALSRTSSTRRQRRSAMSSAGSPAARLLMRARSCCVTAGGSTPPCTRPAPTSSRCLKGISFGTLGRRLPSC